MSASLLVKQAMRATPLMASFRPATTSAIRFNSTSTSVIETREPVALQAEIVSGAPGEFSLIYLVKEGTGPGGGNQLNSGIGIIYWYRITEKEDRWKSSLGTEVVAGCLDVHWTRTTKKICTVLHVHTSLPIMQSIHRNNVFI